MAKLSNVVELECTACGKKYDAEREQLLCSSCGKPLLANVRLAEANGLAQHVTPQPTGLPAQVEPLQLANEPQLPVTPPLAGLPAAETRVPSVGAPVDTTDLALAPPAAAVPPAWDLAEVEASAAEVGVVGEDKRRQR